MSINIAFVPPLERYIFPFPLSTAPLFSFSCCTREKKYKKLNTFQFHFLSAHFIKKVITFSTGTVLMPEDLLTSPSARQKQFGPQFCTLHLSPIFRLCIVYLCVVWQKRKKMKESFLQSCVQNTKETKNKKCTSSTFSLH